MAVSLTNESQFRKFAQLSGIGVPDRVYLRHLNMKLYPNGCILEYLHPKGYNMNAVSLSEYVKSMRREHGLTQVALSEKSGVGLRFVRKLEQGKVTLRLDKVNQVLNLFGAMVGVVPMTKSDNQ